MEKTNQTELTESLDVNSNENKYYVTSSEPAPNSLQNGKMIISFSRSNIFGYIATLFGYSFCPLFVMYFANIKMGISLFASDIFIIIYIFLLCKSKIEIIKANGMLNIIEKSYFAIKRLNLYTKQENIHFYQTSEIRSGEDNDYTIYHLFIINNFKDLKEIDLKTSSIKQKPATLFYHYENLKDNTNSNSLNYFIGSPHQFNNPLLFDIVKYMNKATTDTNPFYNIPSTQNQLSKIMRFNDHLFTYYFNPPKENTCCCDDSTGLFSIPIVNILIWPIAINIALIDFSKMIWRFSGIFIILVFDFICVIYYLCRKRKNVRIDFIYSKDFDELFIGVVVKAINYSYRNTFEYQMKNVNRFILERKLNETILKVELKNNVYETIFCFRNLETTYSDGIIYLLNEKLNVK